MSVENCTICKVEHEPCVTKGVYDHPDLCCECFDLSWFHDQPNVLDTLNRERADAGRPPLTQEHVDAVVEMLRKRREEIANGVS